MNIPSELQINFFILLYLFICFFWSVSNTFHVDQILKNYLGNFIRYAGLWHIWNMYTSPYKFNHLLFAKVTFENGNINVIKVWDPKTKLPFLEIENYCRLRKLIENVLMENSDYGIRKFFCHFLYLEYSKKNNRIVLIELIEESEAIPDFFQKQNFSFPCVSTHTSYTYRIPDDTITKSHSFME